MNYLKHTLRFILALGFIGLSTPALAQKDAAKTADDTYVPADLQPELLVFKDGDTWLKMGASTQLWAIPFAGDEALVDNGDAANEEGFRLRRLRVGLKGSVLPKVALTLTLNPLGSGGDIVHDIGLIWSPHPAARVKLGSGKVPYSRMSLESSSRLHFADRPLGTGELAIGHRLGLTVEGRLWGGALGYVVGVYNATGGFAIGNESKGLLYGARLESEPLGPVAALYPTKFRMRIGGGFVYEDGPTVNTQAVSGDLHLEFHGFRLRGEILFDWREPDIEPQLPSTLPGRVERMVIIGELTGFILPELLEASVRYEWYDNNRDAEDFGDQQLITGGIGLYLSGHRLKLLANYIHRGERAGRDIANDTFVLALVGSL